VAFIVSVVEDVARMREPAALDVRSQDVVLKPERLLLHHHVGPLERRVRRERVTDAVHEAKLRKGRDVAVDAVDLDRLESQQVTGHGVRVVRASNSFEEGDEFVLERALTIG
jgi:hypothetical protein